jgi:integrase
LDEFLNGTPTASSLAEWSESYLDHAKAKYSKKTYDEKKRAFARLFLSIRATLEPSRLHPGVLLQHFDREAMERSGNAANKDRKNLIAAWNWAKRYLPAWPKDNPFAETERQYAEQMPRYIPPFEDFWKVYDSIPEGQDKVMLFTYLHTAARKSELFILRWGEVDFRGNRIKLWTRKRKGGLEADWIPMTEQLKTALQWWYENRTFSEHENVFLCQDKNNYCKDLYGHPFQVRQHWMKKLCEVAKVKPFGIHAIRHLSASILDDVGQPITVIQALLRHKSANTTAKYLHSLRGLRVELDNAFQRPELPTTQVQVANRKDRLTLHEQAANENDRSGLFRGHDRSFLRIVK